MFSTRHTADTPRPQDYGQHFRVAFFGSLKLIGYGLAGIVHAFLPEIKALQFYTSTGIIRAFKAIAESGRHGPEIEREMGGTAVILSPADYDALMTVLDNPPPADARLRRLMNDPAPWE
jgi:hypothetical protein